MKEETVFTTEQLEAFRNDLRRFRYEMTGEIGKFETWTPPPTVVSHVFYVRARNEVDYASTSVTFRALPFANAMELISRVDPWPPP